MDQQRSSIGHDLRSRLTVVKGYAQMLVRLLQREDMPREEILPHAQELERQVAGLETLTASMLADPAFDLNAGAATRLQDTADQQPEHDNS